MLEALIEVARGFNVARVVGSVGTGNAAQRILLERSGFRPSGRARAIFRLTPATHRTIEPTGEVEVRPGTPADLDAALSLYQECFPEGKFPDHVWRTGLERGTVYLAEESGRVLAFLDIDPSDRWIYHLGVTESERSRGVGAVLTSRARRGYGWVEHDPEDLWDSVEHAVHDAAASANVTGSDLKTLGLTNQRETTVVWNRLTGRPVANAIVWQDRRTASRCKELPDDLIREITGLHVDPYFSATKLEWLLRDEKTPVRELAFGTVDSWLVWKLTGGTAHVTDVSNASRTMLMGLRSGSWDETLLELLGIEQSLLPEITSSSGVIADGKLLGVQIPIAGLAGDQSSALFGQACFERGQEKVTYGTGSFVLVNAGSDDGPAPPGLVRTIAWALSGQRPVLALEGSIFITGAALAWLSDLGLLPSATASDEMADSLDDNDGVYFVPALSGLGSPHWKPDARGLVTGITQATRREHVVRAALEAIAYQTKRRGRGRGRSDRRSSSGRWCRRESIAPSVSGRHLGTPSRGAGRAGDDRPRSCGARRAGGWSLVEYGRACGALAGFRAL